MDTWYCGLLNYFKAVSERESQRQRQTETDRTEGTVMGKEERKREIKTRQKDGKKDENESWMREEG